MYSYGSLHMAEQKQGDQLEPTYSSSVKIRGVSLRTCQKRWTIGKGGERESEISVLMARQDDDNERYVKYKQHRQTTRLAELTSGGEKRYCLFGRNFRSVVVTELDSGIIVKGFFLQSKYYIYFSTKFIWNDMNPLNSLLHMYGFWH